MTASAADRVWAIARRDGLLRLSYPFDLLSSIWGVLIGVFTFFFIGDLVGDAPILAGTEGGYFAFAVTGVTVVSLSFVMLNVFRSSIETEQTSGTLELLLAGTTSLRTLFAGSMVVPLVFALFQTLGYVVLGWALEPDALGPLVWLRALPVLLLISGAFVALGLWSAAFVVVAHRGDPFSGLFVQATNLIAGALFPVAVLPEWLQAVAHLIPTFYGFEALRSLMLQGAAWSSVVDELAILAAFDVALALIGVVLLRRALRFARVMGTLGVA